MSGKRFWLAIRCWSLHPISTFRAWLMLRGNDQHYVGRVNGTHHIALTKKWYTQNVVPKEDRKSR